MEHEYDCSFNVGALIGALTLSGCWGRAPGLHERVPDWLVQTSGPGRPEGMTRHRAAPGWGATWPRAPTEERDQDEILWRQRRQLNSITELTYPLSSLEFCFPKRETKLCTTD